MNKLRFFIALFSITLITGVAMAQKVDFQLPKAAQKPVQEVEPAKPEQKMETVKKAEPEKKAESVTGQKSAPKTVQKDNVKAAPKKNPNRNPQLPEKKVEKKTSKKITAQPKAQPETQQKSQKSQNTEKSQNTQKPQNTQKSKTPQKSQSKDQKKSQAKPNVQKQTTKPVPQQNIEQEAPIPGFIKYKRKEDTSSKASQESFDDYMQLTDYELEVQASRNEVAAQTALGYKWFFNAEDTVTQLKGMGWLFKASENNSCEAQAMLGTYYWANQDYETALRLFCESAKQGYPVAEYFIGIALLSGEVGLECDPARAAALFFKAAQQGLPEAQFFLGYCFYYGYGVECDLQLAHEWIALAAENGDEDARNFLEEKSFISNIVTSAA